VGLTGAAAAAAAMCARGLVICLGQARPITNAVRMTRGALLTAHSILSCCIS
jgi:hypothetical protein